MRKTVLAATLAVASTWAIAQQGVSPAQYWQQQASDGYMTKEDALMYPAPNGRSAQDIDTDSDGRVSQSEWARHHGESSPGLSADTAAGTAGVASANADSASAAADGNRNLADDQRRDERGGTLPSTHLGNTGS